MAYYDDVYQRRVNRYGINYQSRVQGEREHSFELYLKKSVYTICFNYNNDKHMGSFEPYKQDESETLHYLLTDIHLDMPAGTILMLPNKKHELQAWMIYWVDQKVASGYNKYVMLKTDRLIEWTASDGVKRNFYCYISSQKDTAMKEEIKSRGGNSSIYTENNNLDMLVTPINKYISKNDYIKISINTLEKDGNGNTIQITRGYRVEEIDNVSTDGIEYVSINPQYKVDETTVPQPEPGHENDDDFFWINKKEYHA